MDPFQEPRPELAGTLVTMEFGPGGRIGQMWASDPALPDEGEDFQFVVPPVQFGEESADDYYPGTILLGVRADPDEPWAVSKNRNATNLNPWEEENYDPSKVMFEYDFPLIEGLKVTGTFYELPGTLPQICWDIELRNSGRRTLEIGEVGLPMAFNNFYDGFGWTDEHLQRLWQSRVYIHKFIGGAASWLFAQRMTAEAPGLLVFPGEDTSWEFTSHVRGSLNTPNQWEGIPVVYILSKATIEREEWPDWFNDHTSLILEPGDSRKFQTRFVPAESDKVDGVHTTLAACGRPTIKVLPGAVAPIDVGIGVEVAGTTPKRFFVSRDAKTETDTDENGGFCFVQPTTPGPLTVSFQDDAGKMSHAHLLFTEPIADLIQKRARWICGHQVVDAPLQTLDSAIVMTNIVDGRKVLDEREFQDTSGLECSLGDALFLAEKCSIYPVEAEIKVIDSYVERFLLDDVQNPGNGAVASLIVDGVPGYFGRPMSYPAVANLYHSMARTAATGGQVSRSETEYLKLAALTVDAMFRHGWRLYVRSVGVLGFARFYELATDLLSAGLEEEHATLTKHLEFKANELMQLNYPYAGETVMDPSGFEEVFAAAKFLSDDDHLERTVRCAFACRSFAPSWWWYGSDKKNWDGTDAQPGSALGDRGETCLAHTTIPNSLIFFGLMDKDYLALPDAYMRMAFGGLLGPWALVRDDGAASMCYCPDLNSKHAGYNLYTGASGLGYYHYLRLAGAYVLPNRDQGIFTFGCHYNVAEDCHIVRPWDGIGRRVVLRQIGAEFRLSFGCFEEVRLDLRLRSASAKIRNPIGKGMKATLAISGLWGQVLEHDGKQYPVVDGEAIIPLVLAADQVTELTVRAITGAGVQ